MDIEGCYFLTFAIIVSTVGILAVYSFICIISWIESNITQQFQIYIFVSVAPICVSSATWKHFVFFLLHLLTNSHSSLLLAFPSKAFTEISVFISPEFGGMGGLSHIRKLLLCFRCRFACMYTLLVFILVFLPTIMFHKIHYAFETVVEWKIE